MNILYIDLFSRHDLVFALKTSKEFPLQKVSRGGLYSVFLFTVVSTSFSLPRFRDHTP